jgi:hypothetical protein
MLKISAVILDTYPDRKMVQRLENVETIHVFSDVAPDSSEKIDFIEIKPITSMNEYGHALFNQVPNHIKNDHLLVFQWDGFPINPPSWSDEFLKYDYIGPPNGTWVGNGGFSLRSLRLFDTLADLKININLSNPFDQLEDRLICTHYLQHLEMQGIRFAPYQLAEKFAYDAGGKVQFKSDVFGFH